MDRAQVKVQNLIPMATLAPMAAARLSSLRGRWAHQVLRGRSYYMDDKLTRKPIHNIITDLGWRPFLGPATIHVVIIYQRCDMNQLTYLIRSGHNRTHHPEELG